MGEAGAPTAPKKGSWTVPELADAERQLLHNQTSQRTLIRSTYVTRTFQEFCEMCCKQKHQVGGLYGCSLRSGSISSVAVCYVLLHSSFCLPWMHKQSDMHPGCTFLQVAADKRYMIHQGLRQSSGDSLCQLTLCSSSPLPPGSPRRTSRCWSSLPSTRRRTPRRLARRH